jgi:DNA-binding LacI/PurR family transcriptional regulator
LRRVAEAGKITPDNGNWIFPSFDWNFDYDAALVRLKKYLTREKPEFLFCNSTTLLSLVYEAAYSLKLEIGKDIIVAGIISGVTVETLFPRYTYLKIPRYEQGVDVMRAASACIRLGIPVNLPVHKVRLVTGQSVNLKKNENNFKQ